MIDLHTGSSFDAFLAEEGILEEIKATAVKRVMAWKHERERINMTDEALKAAARAVRAELLRLDYLDAGPEPDEENEAIALAAIKAWMKASLEEME